MSLAGKLHIRVIWNGKRVSGVEIKSTRPNAFQLLQGQSIDKALHLVPMLFSVCGRAQQAAATAAVSAAQGNSMAQAPNLERAVTCEVMQEHLWRLMLDWPKLLNFPQQQKAFVQWHGALKTIAAGAGNPAALLPELCQLLLGITYEEYKRIDSYAGLTEWGKSRRGLLAPLYSALDHLESNLAFIDTPAATALLPHWTAVEAAQLISRQCNAEFAAKPQHEGKPGETGALADQQHVPLVRNLLAQRTTCLLARLIARVVDLLESAEALMQENGNNRIQAIAAAENTGLSLVLTARGMLMHWVQIEQGQIAKYQGVAPTEWNFHPQGALITGLTGLVESEEQRLLLIVKSFVLSLDPCVEYEIEVSHA
jgi:hypothetical protein